MGKTVKMGIGINRLRIRFNGHCFTKNKMDKTTVMKLHHITVTRKLKKKTVQTFLFGLNNIKFASKLFN
jgi:hypothetical protein